MSSSGATDRATDRAGEAGDPMASIRPELPVLEPTIELSRPGFERQPGAGERDETEVPGPVSPVAAIADETHESGPFTIAVLEPEATAEPGSDAHYELLAQIGEGGMGEVWEARQRALGRVVALKRLRSTKQLAHSVVRQFESEARLTGVLDHPNIVTVHELGRDQAGRVFYTMKLIQGTAWSELLGTNRRRTGDGELVELELRDHLEILLEVSQAIAFAHSRGVIHRDIKPGNVMIGDYGEVLVVDWGLAVALQPLATLAGAETWTLAAIPRSALVCGTPAYMSPETAKAQRERIGTATDVYLLGAVLFHVLYGRPPHKGRSVEEVITKARANGWSFPDEIPRKHEPWDALLRPVINRALASDPKLRFADAAAFGEALREALRHYDSAKLATRAQHKLAAMDLHGMTADDYQQLAAIIAQLEGALESWPRNLGARRALAHAHLELAALALANDDLALASISIDAFEKLPPLPEPEPQRVSRRVTLHPADATLIGAPRPADSLIAAGTSSAWISSASGDDSGRQAGRSSGRSLVGAALSRTIGAAEIAALRRQNGNRRAEGSSSMIDGVASSASVDIQQDTDDALLDDEAKLAARARRLRDAIHEHERQARSRRRALRIAAGLAAALIVVVVVVLTSFEIALRRAHVRAQNERDQLSRVLIDEAANTTEAELEVLFKPVHGALLTAVHWARAGELDIDNPQLLNARFMPLLEGVDAATSMLRADTAGHEYMLLRREQGWRTRSTTPGMARQLHDWTLDGEHERSWLDETPYDPHTRPWYVGGDALREPAREARFGHNPHPVHWTEPYSLFTTRELGISVSAPATSVSGREFVIAFDVKLGDISTFTRALPVGIETGQVFVLDDEFRVIGLPKETRGLSREQEEDSMLEPLTEIAAAPISRAAYLNWRARGGTMEAFRMELAPTEVYWVGFRRVDAVDRPGMWIGVVVPESHFLADNPDRRTQR